MKVLFKRFWPLFLLFFLEGILVSTNYTPATWLVGWDNIMPEFAPKTNVIRSIVGIWQEHRGLGLVDGMSHSAELLHTLIIWLLTAVLPISLVRYCFIFLMHLIGGLGAYFLVKKILEISTPDSHRFHRAVACTGMLYYLFNNAVIQTFAVPFESFVIQFAMLPWLLYGLIAFIRSPSRRSYIAFTILTFIASGQYFVPTLFAGTTAIWFFTLIGSLLAHRKKSLLLFGITIATYTLVNLYWLLPYAATLGTTTPIIKNAKFNEMSSENTILNNQVRGTFLDAITLRGYVLDSDMPNPTTGQFGYFFTPIQKHADSVVGIIASLLIPIMGLTGIILLLVKKRTVGSIAPFVLMFTIIGCIFIGVLGSNIPGISWLHNSLRSTFPLISEAFRDPFTKFRFPLGLTLMILGCSGLAYMMTIQKKKIIGFILVTLTLVGIGYMSIPYWQGYFIHPFMRISLPHEYQQLFSFMKDQPNGRITLLPQATFWSWRMTNYTYTGSGFIWYGLNQPILDRSFDPWSRTSETYYWELSYALYQKNPEKLTNILKKYGVSYIILDQSNIPLYGNLRSMYYDETRTILSAMPNITHLKTFGSIDIYALSPRPDSFVHITKELPSIGPSYAYGDFDQAYETVGEYMTDQNAIDSYYPFRTLFSKKGNAYSSVSIKETPNNIIISAPVPHTISSSTKTIDVPLNKALTLKFTGIAGQEITEKNAYACNINAYATVSVTYQSDASNGWMRFVGNKGNTCLSVNANDLTHDKGYIAAITSRHIQGKQLLVSIANMTAKHTELDEFLGKKSTWQTDFFIIPPLTSDGKGYSVHFTNEAKGVIDSINDVKEIRFFEIPYKEMVSYSEVEIASPSARTVNTLDSRRSLSRLSQGGNDITESVDHPNPAYYKVNIQSSPNLPISQSRYLILSQSFDPGWKAYELYSCTSSTIFCQIKNNMQEFFPFIFGTELKEHILVNNWENGWNINSSQSIVQGNKSNILSTNNEQRSIILFFLPQLLQWIGFLCMPLPFIAIFIQRKKRN